MLHVYILYTQYLVTLLCNEVHTLCMYLINVDHCFVTMMMQLVKTVII